MQQAAVDYPGENAKLWKDTRNPDSMLDLASTVLSVSPDRTQIRMDLFFFEPFNGYHLGFAGDDPGGDAAWIQLDTDRNPYTGSRLPSFGQPIIGYEYMVSFGWDTALGWHVNIIRTPTDDVGSWYIVGTFSASQSSNGTYSHLKSEFALSRIGSPSEFDFITWTSYDPAGGGWVNDYIPEPPSIGTYIIGTSTVTTLPPTTTTTNLPPTTTTSTTTTTEPPATTTTTEPPPSFTDVSQSHPYGEAIESLAGEDIINGYQDNTFRPDEPVWRQHFAKMIVLALGLPCDESDVSPFGDVTRGGQDTLYPDNYIAVAEEQGITKGTGPDTFAPYENISRAQVITMVVRAATRLVPGLLTEPPPEYQSTWGPFSPTHTPSTRIAEYNDLLIGIPLSQVEAWGDMPRGEVAQVLHNYLSISEASLPGEGKTVNIGWIPWGEDIAATYLWKNILEGQGYTVELTQLDLAFLYAGLAQGDLDLFLDAWLPQTHRDYWDQYGDQLEELTTWYDKGLLTWAVPTYVDVDSIADLKGKADTFNGEIIGIEPGAGLTRVSREDVKPGYELDGYEIVEGSTPAMLSELDRATSRGEPIVVTLWRPHWAYAAYDIKDLEDPKGLLGEAENLKALARPGFSEDFPTLAEWMGNFKMSDEALASLEQLVLNDYDIGEEPAAVEEWLSDSANQDIVNGWIGK